MVDAWPSASVVSVTAERVPPSPVRAKVTTAPGRADPFWSSTEITRGSGSSAPGSDCCSSPEGLVKLRGMAMPSAVNVTGASPATVTSTVLGPGARPRVRVLEARPWASVVTVVTERVPPPAVTAKVTVASA